MNLSDMVRKLRELGYETDDAEARVCQDIVLKAISKSTLSRNVTIKGGVVMRSITNNIRRATQDMDIDFIRYSLSDESVDNFVAKLNCIEGITITRVGRIEELSQQDYKGKRVNVHIKPSRLGVCSPNLQCSLCKQEEQSWDLVACLASSLPFSPSVLTRAVLWGTETPGKSL